MNDFSLNHINDTQFEEFCFDLLCELGFINIVWRKGTGLSTSTSDQGRDIECYLRKCDIDGTEYLEKWFIECKHYRKGVPPQEIQGLLTWSLAERPDVVLIIASNFLSNPTKNFLEKYEKENKPSFKIKFWELPDLYKLTIGKSLLLRKFNISGEFGFLKILHPAHIIYLREMKFNSLDYFFKILDDLDPSFRDRIFSWAYEFIIKPRYSEPVTGKETLNDLRIDKVSYDIFKNKCIEIVESNLLDECLLIYLIISLVLWFQLGVSDFTDEDQFVNRMNSAIKFFQEKKQTCSPEEIKELDHMISSTKERILHAHTDIKKNYKEYENFCNSVVTKLLLERIF